MEIPVASVLRLKAGRREILVRGCELDDGFGHWRCGRFSFAASLIERWRTSAKDQYQTSLRKMSRLHAYCPLPVDFFVVPRVNNLAPGSNDGHMNFALCVAQSSTGLRKCISWMIGARTQDGRCRSKARRLRRRARATRTQRFPENGYAQMIGAARANPRSRRHRVELR